MKPVLTPRELAQAIGVSESSVKRWVDDGAIAATKTTGGHRRIPISDAVRFIRDNQSVLHRPDVLGLSDITSVAEAFPKSGEEADALYRHLVDGAADHVKGLVLTLYLNGLSVADIVDGPLQESMSILGQLGEHSPEAVFVEHRATDIALQAINRLRALLPRRASSPIAVGAAAPGDVYQLPSLCAATVLEAAGLEAVNLGADLPIASLETAASRLGAALVWVSATASTIPESTGLEIQALADRLAQRQVLLIVGGQKASTLGLRTGANLRIGRSMGELEAVAQGMRFSASAAPPN